MQKKICLLEGDGIGPEILAQGVLVLEEALKKSGQTVTFERALLGGAAIDATGEPLPEATVTACKAADAVFLAAEVGRSGPGKTS